MDKDALLVSISAASTASVCFVKTAKGFSTLSIFFISSSHHEYSWKKLILALIKQQIFFLRTNPQLGLLLCLAAL